MAHSPIDENMAVLLRQWARAATEADRCDDEAARWRHRAGGLKEQLADRIGSGRRVYAHVGSETYRLSVDDDGHLTIEVI